ncbi:triose-phosphate isomerase [Candidatus Nomurabacteria bacterium]|nr:triose-phosphate isomerase [Candidatus Nomurabacteria bacterium]
MQNRKNRKKIVIGNWKMEPDNLKDAKKIFSTFIKKKLNAKNTTVVICPPNLFLSDIAKSYKGHKVFFGAQNVSNENKGAFTGEISPKMLQSAGARFVIVGHSERRALGESNSIVSKKVKNSLSSGLHTVVCIGENERDEDGEHLRFIEKQLTESLLGVSKNLLKKIIIAYEPIWTIGKGKKAMNIEDIERTVLFIRKILASIYNKKIAYDISIIYGGSVNSDNANEIVFRGNVDGLLPGRASLNPEEFSKIINEVGRK